MRLSSYFCIAFAFVSASIAAPTTNAAPDADDLVRNSWSAKRGPEAGADADDLVRNSWSAKRGPEAGADADDLVRNSWSA